MLLSFEMQLSYFDFLSALVFRSYFNNVVSSFIIRITFKNTWNFWRIAFHLALVLWSRKREVPNYFCSFGNHGSFVFERLIFLLLWYSRGIPEYAILLCFLSGSVTIVLGILRLGFLVEFVSMPVVSGFTSAASLIIACSQIKSLLGLKIHGESFIEIWRELVNNIHRTRIPDLILSCCCILILLTLKVIHHGLLFASKTSSCALWIRKKGKKKTENQREKRASHTYSYNSFLFPCRSRYSKMPRSRIKF